MSGQPPESRPAWKHKKGDEYLPVTHYPQCDANGPLWYDTSPLGGPFPTRALAWREGCSVTQSDDFNIAVIRGRSVVAWLWNDEVIDEDQAFLDEMTKELCP